MKIKALEEYCLNVDYTRFPVPKPLEYLFKKTTGTYEFHDNNPPVDRCEQDSSNQYPVHIDERRYSYEGELINGKPGGNGTIKYGEKVANDRITYSCTYTGTFLNGMKHGNGQLEVKGKGWSTCIYQQRYSYDKKDGIFVIKYDNGRVVSQTYVDDARQHTCRWLYGGGAKQQYLDMKDDLLHGCVIEYDTDDKILVRSFVAGKKQTSETFFKRG